MKPWVRYLVTIVAGLAIGVGAAVASVRTRSFGSNAAIGPWTTGTDFGIADAGALTRAVIAVKGLLALPASEARYYTAAVDDDGRALDGKCRYRVTGGALPGRWWSVTLYGADSFLVANDANIFSVASPAIEPGAWTIMVAPDRQPGHWLPTGGVERFDLTLRTYLPPKGTPPREALPRIARLECAS